VLEFRDAVADEAAESARRELNGMPVNAKSRCGGRWDVRKKDAYAPATDPALIKRPMRFESSLGRYQ
jgi:hypothetical protein